MDGGSSAVLLPAEGSPIVQLECNGVDAMIASTWVRTILLSLPSDVVTGAGTSPANADAAAALATRAAPRAVGKAKRDGCGGLLFARGGVGGCHGARRCSERCARPRLSSADSTVKSRTP